VGTFVPGIRSLRRGRGVLKRNEAPRRGWRVMARLRGIEAMISQTKFKRV